MSKSTPTAPFLIVILGSVVNLAKPEMGKKREGFDLKCSCASEYHHQEDSTCTINKPNIIISR